jgi:hypothetical protein
MAGGIIGRFRAKDCCETILGVSRYCLFNPWLWAVVGANTAAYESSLSTQFTSASESYISSSSGYFRNDASSQLPSFDFAVQTGFKSGTYEGVFNVDDRYSFIESANYIHPNEVNLSTHVGDSTWYVGRTQTPWSNVDKDFQTGLFTPRYMEDKLVAAPSALTGVTGQVAAGPVHANLFVSPVFIPEFGPQVNVDNGMLVSRNPWFTPPTPSVRLFEQTGTTNVQYGITAPPTAQTIEQLSVVTGLGWEDNGTYIRGTLADKPMNQLLLSFPFKVLTLQDSTSLDVNIHARSVRHQLYQMETGHDEDGGWHGHLSFIHEQPDTDPVPSDWISQTTTPANIYSGGIGYDLARSGPKATYLGLSFIKVDGGDAADRGPFSGSTSFFERRYHYTKSVKAEFATMLYLKGRTGLRGSTYALYDFDQHGMVWSSAVEYLQQEMRAFFKVDVMGVIDEASVAVADGFIRTYRANDRVSLGLSYVF